MTVNLKISLIGEKKERIIINLNKQTNVFGLFASKQTSGNYFPYSPSSFVLSNNSSGVINDVIKFKFLIISGVNSIILKNIENGYVDFVGF